MGDMREMRDSRERGTLERKKTLGRSGDTREGGLQYNEGNRHVPQVQQWKQSM